jgi:hypothetical protein
MTRSEPPVHIPFPSTQNINRSVMDTSAVMDHRAAPSLSAEDKRRIERVARYVARDRDGDLTEKLLLRLLDITRNTRRWGFLAPEHPLHLYYLQQKVSERCRILRPRAAAATADQ